MVSYKSPTIDIRVTNKHRMIIRTRHGRKKIPSQWRFETAESLFNINTDYNIPISGYQKSTGVSLTDDEIRFIGWFMTDGCLNKINSCLTISQASHQKWNDDIVSCLDGCGFKYSIYRQTPKSKFHANSDRLVYYVSRNPRGGSTHLKGWSYLTEYLDKHFSILLDNVSNEQLEVLLYAMHLGNGQKQENQYWTRRSYHICIGLHNRLQAERLQSLCIRRGYKCNMSITEGRLIILRIKKKTFSHIGSTGSKDRPIAKISDHSNDEIVWCIENEMQTLVTQRNGKVAIVGNCIGRATRLYPDTSQPLHKQVITPETKIDMIVIDICDNAGKHSLVSVPQLFGLPPKAKMQGESATELSEQFEMALKVDKNEQGRHVPQEQVRKMAKMMNLLAGAENKVRSKSKFNWLEPAKGLYTLSLTDTLSLEATQDLLGTWRTVLCNQKQRLPLYEDTDMLRMIREADDWVEKEFDFKIGEVSHLKILRKSEAWRKHPATQKQLNYLNWKKIPYYDGITKGEACNLRTLYG